MWNAFIVIECRNVKYRITTILWAVQCYPFCCHGDDTPIVCCRKKRLPLKYQRHHIRITVKWFVLISCNVFEGGVNAMWVGSGRLFSVW